MAYLNGNKILPVTLGSSGGGGATYYKHSVEIASSSGSNPQFKFLLNIISQTPEPYTTMAELKADLNKTISGTYMEYNTAYPIFSVEYNSQYDEFDFCYSMPENYDFRTGYVILTNYVLNGNSSFYHSSEVVEL